MKLEQQVTSLALSKRLKELGVKQESFFYWSRVARSSGTNWELIWADSGEYPSDLVGMYAAYTVAELGELLSNHQNMRFFKANLKDGMEWVAVADFNKEYGSTEAESRGLMLEYLITNKLMTV